MKLVNVLFKSLPKEATEGRARDTFATFALDVDALAAASARSASASAADVAELPTAVVELAGGALAAMGPAAEVELVVLLL